MIYSRFFAVLGLFFALFSTGALAQQMQFDADVSPELRAQVLGDFGYLQGVRSIRVSPLHQQIFGAVDGASYLQWFDARVFRFGVDGCGGASAVACTKDGWPNKIWVTNNYIQINHPQIARVMTLFHEGRHTEVEHDNWPHARCPLSFPYRSIWTGSRLRGNHACDSTEFGSYASASVMLNNISKFCVTCSDKVRADAKLYSDDQVKRVISSAAISRLKTDFAF